MSKRFIRPKHISAKTGICLAKIKQLVNDQLFPRPYKLVPGNDAFNAPVGWLESEVDAWIDQRVASSRSSSPK